MLWNKKPKIIPQSSRSWDRKDTMFKFVNHGQSDSNSAKIEGESQVKECSLKGVLSCSEVVHKTMSVSNRSQVEHWSYMCTRHFVYDAIITIIKTQSEISHVGRY